MFVNRLLKQLAICLGVVAILLVNVMEVFSVAPNDTVFTRCSCHSGLENPVQIVSTPPRPQQWGTRLSFLGKPVMRNRMMAGNAPHESGRCRDESKSDKHTQTNLDLRYLSQTNTG